MSNSNSGDYNSGDYNSGEYNSGNYNSGNYNSGDWNSGDWNSGDYNSGKRNSGDCNSGYFNSGDYNSGKANSGHWNSGDSNSGYFNSQTPDTITVFNKPCDRQVWFYAKKPDFIYFGLTEWISWDDMSNQEKSDHPEARNCQGYLKTYEYQEAWRKAWDSATEEDKELLFKLPNFDPEVFKEISGIDVNESQEVKMTVAE